MAHWCTLRACGHYHAGPGRTVAQLASSPVARCCWLPCPARAARPWRPPALKLPATRRHTAIRGPYQLGSAAAMARCRWSSVVVAAWLARQCSSAVAGDGEARRAGVLMRRRGSGDGKARGAGVLMRRRGSGDALGRAQTTGRGVFGQRRTRRSLSGGCGRGDCRGDGGAGEAVAVGRAQ
jgi:hypothetical protein